ncbi:hypothetical protein KRP69_12180 [Mammaliicoccus sciuri]|uniref:hypothetical protein n=1 Tax=Mammaliicoccus sciuri TaxID=1296 RepID=UPI001D0D4FF8|nr:hypothetical protein [Mammaliicoccus sciuri]MCC2089973.1 hypothetical protein [Mammaliicoccus sciuri]
MDFKKKTQEKFDQSKNYIKENDIKGKSGNLLHKFIKGLKLGKRIPVLICYINFGDNIMDTYDVRSCDDKYIWWK